MKYKVFMPIFLFVLIGGPLAQAAEKINFNYRGQEIQKVIEDYAKATGQKFIIEPNVRGTITILNPEPIEPTEAFNQLSSALAANGIGISTQGDVMNVMNARNLQRNLIPVVHEPPPLKPERMVTMIVQLKYVSADEVNKQLRILSSREGELVPFLHNNSIVVSDWTSNLNRVAQILKELDVPAAKTTKAKN